MCRAFERRHKLVPRHMMASEMACRAGMAEARQSLSLYANPSRGKQC
jgi:hypothetical protein